VTWNCACVGIDNCIKFCVLRLL